MRAVFICLALTLAQSQGFPAEGFPAEKVVIPVVDVVPELGAPVKVISPVVDVIPEVVVAEKITPVVEPVSAERIPIIPFDEHHPAQVPMIVRAEKVPVVDTLVVEPGYVKVEARALALKNTLKRLQDFERNYMANPFPVDEHFRLVFDSMRALGVEEKQLETLRDGVFKNLETAQKATYEHSYKINTVIDLVDELIARMTHEAPKEAIERNEVALEEVFKLLRADFAEIRVRINRNLENYTGTIRALTDVYTNPDASVVKRHMKLVRFIYDLGHDELEDVLGMLEDDWNQFLADYQKFIEDIVSAVEDFIDTDKP